MSQPTKSVRRINGPNPSRLGTREPAIYGTETLEDVAQRVRRRAAELGCEVDFRQSNLEGEIVTWIQTAGDYYDAVILNPGAFAHYSYAISDAVTAGHVRLVEVPLSNISAREEFR